jgi:5-methylcytosine-specific restriction enzyme subunit McrC
MLHIDLREYQGTECTLALAQRDELVGDVEALNLTIGPIVGTGDGYMVTPGSTVGALEVGDMSVRIEPKIGIPQLLSLACYSMRLFKPQQDKPFDFREDEALPDVLALALAAAARQAFAHGLLHGYRVEEDSLQTVRGRVRINDQIRQRPGFMLPVEVRYDEFTEDILENRLVKAAAAQLSRMRLRSQDARAGLSWVVGMLEQVALVEFSARDLPETRFTRLNEHYREVLALAHLILRHSAFSSARGAVRASGFLVNMNNLFQEFLTVALRESLGVSSDTLRSEREVELDEGGRATLKPDLSWWDDGICTFVGDVKYKNLTGKMSVPGTDLYQLLAYVTALDLSGGLLIYAQGEADTTSYIVKHADKLLEVVALDLSGTLDEVLARVDCVATRVRELRERATRALIAA